ncbi:MAG: phosphoribosylformylglycinamidine synthase subunit PurQ [Phycisphaerae bacterium]|nr:phosphoribosylformylglycinamidine synthase subunit PurQ [Phycisphaerae bacterium]
MPRALVLRTAGTNCDAEMVRAFELAGASVGLVHLDALVRAPERIADFDLIGFPGGFSYGDDIASGRIFAAKVRIGLYPALRAAARRGVPMIGICNGFQVMVQAGLLPGPDPGCQWPEAAPPEPTASLAVNASGRFIDTWVRVRAEAASRCLWTRPWVELAARPEAEDILRLPTAHGEGRLVLASPDVLARLERAGQVALRYVDNPSGSTADIAGLCDATGRIFGLMPHPERYLDWNRHPFWTRMDPMARNGLTPGRLMFEAAVRSVGATLQPA